MNVSRFLKRPIFLVSLFLAFVIGGVGTYLFLSQGISKPQDRITPGITPTIITDISPAPTVNPDQSYTILLLGYGGTGHDGGSLSDVLMAVRIDPKSKKVQLISIPRDLWVPIPVDQNKTVNYKINAAFAIGGDDNKYSLKKDEFKGPSGGANLAKYSVSFVTGIPVQSFIAVDFSGFKQAIDSLGGLEVDVPVAFDDYFYPIKGLGNETCGKSAAEIAQIHQQFSGFNLEKQFTCRYEHLHFEKGIQHMDGETALKFVRSRHSDQNGNDFARSQRQQALLIALKDKLISLQALDHIDDFYQKFIRSIKTDLTPEILKNMVLEFGNPSGYSIKRINLSEENVLKSSTGPAGQYILIPKAGEGGWGTVQEYLKSEIDK